MTERPLPHLTDAALNEYLDEALAPSARAQVEAHLAVCDGCERRLAALQALFAGLAALPDAALSRDLAPAILHAVWRPAPVPERRGWLEVVVWLQMLAAALAAALAWPYLTGWLAALPRLGANLLRDGLAAVQGLVARLNPVPLLASWQAAAASAWAALAPDALGLGPAGWLAAAAGAGLVWLVGHLWLLRGVDWPHPRRR